MKYISGSGDKERTEAQISPEVITEAVKMEGQEILIREKEERDEIITSTVFKEAKGTRAGVAFARDETGAIIVYKMKESSIFSSTLLMVGDEIISINDISCEGKTSNEVAQIIKKADGFITVVARGNSSNGKNRRNEDLTTDSPAGKRKRRKRRKSGSIDDQKGPHKNSLNKSRSSKTKGTRKQKIGTRSPSESNPSQNSSERNAHRNEDTVPDVTIDESKYLKITATVIKKSEEVKTGVGLKKQLNGTFLVNRVLENSLFSRTDIKIGDEVVSVNGIDCMEMTTTDVTNLFTRTTGSITMLARRRRGTSSGVTTIGKVRRDVSQECLVGGILSTWGNPRDVSPILKESVDDDTVDTVAVQQKSTPRRRRKTRYPLEDVMEESLELSDLPREKEDSVDTLPPKWKAEPHCQKFLEDEMEDSLEASEGGSLKLLATHSFESSTKGGSGFASPVHPEQMTAEKHMPQIDKYRSNVKQSIKEQTMKKDSDSAAPSFVSREDEEFDAGHATEKSARNDDYRRSKRRDSAKDSSKGDHFGQSVSSIALSDDGSLHFFSRTNNTEIMHEVESPKSKHKKNGDHTTGKKNPSSSIASTKWSGLPATRAVGTGSVQERDVPQGCTMSVMDAWNVEGPVADTPSLHSLDTGTIDTGTIDTGTIDTRTIDTGTIDTRTIDTRTTASEFTFLSDASHLPQPNGRLEALENFFVSLWCMDRTTLLPEEIEDNNSVWSGTTLRSF